VLFDAVAVVVSAKAAQRMAQDAAAVAFVHDAFAHLKVIGHSPDAQPLLTAAGVQPDEGIVAMAAGKAAARFAEVAAAGRIWNREEKVRVVF
jgi:catalase